jgi:hypothetical protein
MRPGHGGADDACMNRALIIVATLPLAVIVASCGDDDDADTVAAARTDAQYCSDLQALPTGEGPTDAFFAAHPDPTLEDWAEGLPDVIETAKSQRDEFAAIDPSTGLADERQALLDAFGGVISSFESSLDAAEAGDQDAFDAEEKANQDTNVPALMDAFEALTGACGAGQ